MFPMYLLYEKEVSQAMRAEQERLLFWIEQAAKLNPDADLTTILSAAESYVSNATFVITKDGKSLSTQREISRSVPKKITLVEPKQQEAVEYVETVVPGEPWDYNPVEEETVIDDTTELNTDDVVTEELEVIEQETVEVENTEQDVSFTKEELALWQEESVGEHIHVDEEVAKVREEKEEVEATKAEQDTQETESAAEVSARLALIKEEEDKKQALKQNHQLTVRANYAAIFGDKNEISDL